MRHEVSPPPPLGLYYLDHIRGRGQQEVDDGWKEREGSVSAPAVCGFVRQPCVHGQ